MDYKIILGYSAVVIAIIGYIPYLRDIFSGRTKPHAFSWLMWTLLTGIAFAVQLVEDAGAGAWVTGFTASICLLIVILALVKGDRKFVAMDWFALAMSLLALLLWVVTKQPLAAVLLITLADGFAFIPTFRKGYHKPFEDTLSTFLFAAIKFFIGILALQQYSLTTWLYPASLVLMNGLFVTMLLVRRRRMMSS